MTLDAIFHKLKSVLNYLENFLNKYNSMDLKKFVFVSVIKICCFVVRNNIFMGPRANKLTSVTHTFMALI